MACYQHVTPCHGSENPLRSGTGRRSRQPCGYGHQPTERHIAQDYVSNSPKFDIPGHPKLNDRLEAVIVCRSPVLTATCAGGQGVALPRHGDRIRRLWWTDRLFTIAALLRFKNTPSSRATLTAARLRFTRPGSTRHPKAAERTCARLMCRPSALLLIPDVYISPTVRASASPSWKKRHLLQVHLLPSGSFFPASRSETHSADEINQVGALADQCGRCVGTPIVRHVDRHQCPGDTPQPFGEIETVEQGFTVRRSGKQVDLGGR